jgi:hypothetical protein
LLVPKEQMIRKREKENERKIKSINERSLKKERKVKMKGRQEI